MKSFKMIMEQAKVGTLFQEQGTVAKLYIFAPYHLVCQHVKKPETGIHEKR